MPVFGKIFSRASLLVSIAFALLTACSSSSLDPTVVAAEFSAQGIKGSISGQNITLDLSELGNCATNVENMTLDIQANGASISPDPRVARDYSQPVQFTITAPDGTKVVYTVTVKGAACLQGVPPNPPNTATPDTTPPVITVQGTNPLSLTVGTAYTDAGATCTDNTDTSCTVVSTGSVNTATAGSYTITYTATDAAGNASSKARVVNVVAFPCAGSFIGSYDAPDHSERIRLRNLSLAGRGIPVTGNDEIDNLNAGGGGLDGGIYMTGSYAFETDANCKVVKGTTMVFYVYEYGISGSVNKDGTFALTWSGYGSLGELSGKVNSSNVISGEFHHPAPDSFIYGVMNGKFTLNGKI